MLILAARCDRALELLTALEDEARTLGNAVRAEGENTEAVTCAVLWLAKVRLALEAQRRRLSRGVAVHHTAVPL
jgi:hypothetical protein